MSTFTRESFDTLAQTPPGHCISIFMPTHRKGTDRQQDPIRLKNLLKQAEGRLAERALKKTDIDALLGPAYDLLNDTVFWNFQDKGLAIFLAENRFENYQVPMEFEELVIVNSRFHVKPLLPMMSGDGRFYILALSQNDVRLFQATRYTLNQVNLANIPTSKADALWYIQRERSLQHHVVGTGSVFHGNADEGTKNDLFQFFRQVNDGLHDLLHQEKAPVVLAGVEYLLPIYRDANTYPHLITDQWVTGNPEHISPEELQARAWAIVEPYFTKSRKDAVERFHRLNRDGSTSTMIEEIVPAAHHSRVDTLLVAKGKRIWGAFDAETDTTELRDTDAQDLLDLASVQTLLNGGTVYVLDAADMPNQAAVAAILRY